MDERAHDPHLPTVDYPFQLDNGRAWLRLPKVITERDVERLAAMLATLVAGGKETGDGL